MTNGNLETQVAALEADVQEIRALLQQAATNIVALTQAQERTQQQVDSNARSIGETDAIAKSNARSIEAWEALIEQNKVDAEEERSELRVMIRDLIRASQQNVIDHELFRRRFEAIDPLIDDSSQD